MGVLYVYNNSGSRKEFGTRKNGGLIWSLPNDLKFFKEKTTGKKVFMGLNTFRSLPKNYQTESTMC